MKHNSPPARSIFPYSRPWAKTCRGIFLLSLLIALSPWQPAFPAISRSTDARGTIHITNDSKAAPGQDTVAAQASGQPGSAAAANPQVPTPSNIFPEPEEPVTPAFLAAGPESPPESTGLSPEPSPKP